MKIVFVHKGREHLGIEYLSSALKGVGHQVELVWDLGLFGSEDNVFNNKFLERIFKNNHIVDEIISINPDIVAFSVYSSTYQWACSVASSLKNCISASIIFGGIHATLSPKEVISKDFVDYVHMGEGEITFLELVNSIEKKKCPNNINNLCYRRNGTIFVNSLHEPVKDLDHLPLPDKELFSKHVHYNDDS